MTDIERAREKAKEDGGQGPGRADLPHHHDGVDTGSNPNVETDQLDSLLPDKNGDAEERPIPTGV